MRRYRSFSPRLALSQQCSERGEQHQGDTHTHGAARAKPSHRESLACLSLHREQRLLRHAAHWPNDGNRLGCGFCRLADTAVWIVLRHVTFSFRRGRGVAWWIGDGDG